MAIRPSIYIGLGGTGIMAVSCIKKLFVDAYKGVDNIPGQIAFIAIDFDSAAIDNSNLPADMHDDFLSFSSTAVTSSKTLYWIMSQMGDCSWMFPNNVRFLPPSISDGAGQVRTNGRFLTEMVQDSIIRRISDCITQIRSIQAKLETDWAGNLPIDIHIAMSLAGGTGSGSFLNVAQLIRERFQNQVHIIGYGVLHSVFRTMDPSGNKTPRVVANAYSAILDLDYLLEATKNKIQISLNGRSQVLRTPIYDEFYVVDNETEFGERVDHVDELCGVIGLGMYMHSYVMRYLGHLGWKTGLFDIPPKLGWVQALGACQVVYKGEELAEIYSLKAALNLITNLQNSSLDVDKAAIDWAVENKVREDLNFDQLIDTICDIKKVNINTVPLDIDDSLSEIRQRVERYVKTRPGFIEDKDLKKLIQELKISLRDKVEALTSAENGVANFKGFLSSLMKNLTVYRTEMEVERVLYEKKVADRMPVLATEYKNYEAYSKRLFKSKRTMSTMLEEGIGKVAKDILIDNLEAERRKVAAEIFTVLLTDVNALYDRVKELDNKLFALKKQYKEELVSKQNVDTSLRFFEYDLSAKDRQKVEFEPTDYIYYEFFRNLGTSLLDIDVNEELSKRLLAYCAALPQANMYRYKLIVNVVEELSPEDYATFKEIVLEKSSRLLRLDNRGQKVGNSLATAAMVQRLFILINKLDNTWTTRLERDTRFFVDDAREKEFIYSDADSMKQKMIFYRSDRAIIPYCIAAFDENTVEREYNALLRDAMTTGTTSFNPHFDKQIFEAMRQVDFKLKPEMQNEAEFYWVCGNFFGWTDIIETQYIMEKNDKNEAVRIESKENVSHTKYIRCHKGKYQVWNENGMSTGVDGKWVSLGNINHRDKAFNYFKTVVLPELKNTLHDRILELLIANGRKGYKLLIQGIIDDGKTDYINKIACTDKNSLTYCSEQNGEQDRFNKEWEFIVKDLINVIDNFK